MENIFGYSIDSIVFISNENRKNNSDEVSMDDIFQEVCRIFEEKPEMVKSCCRKRKYLFCRYVFAYVSYRLLVVSLKEVANYLNGKDHTTILSSNKKVKQWIKDKEPVFMEYWYPYTHQSRIWKNYINR